MSILFWNIFKFFTLTDWELLQSDNHWSKFAFLLLETKWLSNLLHSCLLIKVANLDFSFFWKVQHIRISNQLLSFILYYMRCIVKWYMFLKYFFEFAFCFFRSSGDSNSLPYWSSIKSYYKFIFYPVKEWWLKVCVVLSTSSLYYYYMLFNRNCQ